MNLGKLLAAGRSIFGGQGAVAYRTNKNVYLPKFNVNGAEETTPAPAKPAAAATPPKPTVSGRLNPFRPAKPAAETPARTAVQAELALQAVKVLNNDLVDADIPVVPVRSRTRPPREAVILPAPRAGVLDMFAGRELTSA